MRTIHAEDILAALSDERIAGRPHYVQPLSAYTFPGHDPETGEPDAATCYCFVGEVLDIIGTPVPRYGTKPNDAFVQDLVRNGWFVEHNTILHAEALRLLVIAQELADHDVPWGFVADALTKAPR